MMAILRGCELSKRGFAKRSLVVLFAIVLAAVSQSSLADLTDASWTVRRAGSDVEIVNMNKASFRKYAFHRASGMLKCIGWNVRQPEKFYINGESMFVLSCDGKEKCAEFVSFDARENKELCGVEDKRADDVLATAVSRHRVPGEAIDVLVGYRFRRDNEVFVDCEVIAKKQLPSDSSFSIAYPISRDYEIGDCDQEVYKIGLSRRQDDGLVSLFFRSRVCAEDKKREKMKVTVRSRGNALSPTHDRLLTLSASLGEPAKRSDGSFAYSFNFSIPLYAPRWWQFWL